MPATPRPHNIPDADQFIRENERDQLRAEILRELLRQARQSYNLALVITTGSALITLAGVGLLYFEKISAASVTAASGAIASISCIQIAKESKEELREMMDQVSQ